MNRARNDIRKSRLGEPAQRGHRGATRRRDYFYHLGEVGFDDRIIASAPRIVLSVIIAASGRASPALTAASIIALAN